MTSATPSVSRSWLCSGASRTGRTSADSMSTPTTNSAAALTMTDR
jgi:hypothetical protein